MRNKNRNYWEKIIQELQEINNNDCYDENKIPDLEELALSCPYQDLSSELLMYAITIECRSIYVN